MSFPIIFGGRSGRGGRGGRSFLNLTITTTASPQTVRIQQLTPQIDSTIDWGDGTTTLIVANRTSVIDKTYATAGVYKVKVQNPDRIVSLDLRVAAIGGLNTRDLRNAPMTGTFLLTSLGTGCVLDSAYMVDWRPSDWRLSGMPAGTYTINSADMTDWRPTAWYFHTMPAGTYTVNSADMTDWRPTAWVLYTMPAGTYTVNSADMTDWRPTTWYFLTMPAGTYTINSADITNWRPRDWRLSGMPAAGSSYTFAASCMRAWITARVIRAASLGINTAAVDAVINDIYEGRAGYTWATPLLDVGGATNGTPDGIYQDPAPNPPASALEQVWVLANDHPWAITWNGGSAP